MPIFVAVNSSRNDGSIAVLNTYVLLGQKPVCTTNLFHAMPSKIPCYLLHRGWNPTGTLVAYYYFNGKLFSHMACMGFFVYGCGWVELIRLLFQLINCCRRHVCYSPTPVVDLIYGLVNSGPLRLASHGIMKLPQKDLIHPIRAVDWKSYLVGLLWATKLAVLARSLFLFFIVLVAAISLAVCALLNIADFRLYGFNERGRLHPSWIVVDSRFLLGNRRQGRDLLSVNFIWHTTLTNNSGYVRILIQAHWVFAIGLVSAIYVAESINLWMRCADIQLSFSNMMVALSSFGYFPVALGQARYQQLADIIPLVIGLPNGRFCSNHSSLRV